MKILFFLFIASSTCLISGYSQSVQTAINLPYTSSASPTSPALLHKPNDYATATATYYPLLIFLHGAGEAGTNLANIYNNSSAGGPAYFIEHNGWPASFTNPANAQAYKFLVVSPQRPGGWSWQSTQLNYFIQYMVNNYRVDVNRIYITGLSAGGEGAVGYAAHLDLESGNPVTPIYKIVAFVPMSAAISSPPQSWANTIVGDGVRAWGFGSVPADIHGEQTNLLINKINIASAGFGRFTNYSGGHCCWNTFYNPTYRENIGGTNMNIYEWMLQYSRGSSNPPPQNQPPVANTGPNQTITLPVNSVNVTGSGTDADGTVVSYSWTKVSGPSQFTIVSPTQAQTTINNLVQGTYQFELKVTDNLGATGSANIIITVNTATPPANQPPVAQAGPDQTITLPVNAVNMSGSGSDADGTIAGYNWTKVSGPTQFTISNPNITNPSITNLIAGSYLFRLTVTDNNGATGFDNVAIQVNAAVATGKQIPGRIEAENYDNMSGVAKEPTADAGGGQNVGWISDGDWMDYNVTVNSGGNYTVNFRVASPNTGGRLQLKKGTAVLTTVNIPTTGSWQTWQTVSTTVSLQAGAQTIRIHSLKGGWNINWFEFLQTQSSGSAKYVNVNIYAAATPYNNSEWNNWDLSSSYSNISSPVFKYSDGINSTINALLTRSDDVGDNSSSYTGSMAPGNVLRYTSYSSQLRTLTINGLSAGKTYSIELYASRNINPANSTVYSVNGNNITIASYNNLTNKASFTNIIPDTQGKIVIGINNLNTYNYLNGFILTETTGSALSARANQPDASQQSESLTILPGDIINRFALQVTNNITGLMNIQIIDMQGNLQKEFNVLKSQVEPTQVYLSVGGLASGEYVINVRMDKWSGSMKILKQ